MDFNQDSNPIAVLSPLPRLIKKNLPTSSPNSETGLPEWGIVELQGDLEVRENQIMCGQFVGDLCYNKYGQPVTKPTPKTSSKLNFKNFIFRF